MKKYISFLVFAVVIGLFSFSANFANAQTAGVITAGCRTGDFFSRTTGQPCNSSYTPNDCMTGDLFSSVTGKACTTTVTPPTDTTCPVLSSNPDFKIGSKGEDVKVFQQKLNDAGFPVGKIDGVYGSKTDGARINFYKRCPLPPTPIDSGNNPVISGITGPQTLNIYQTGKWTIKASSANGGNLSYSVNWNDNNIGGQSVYENSLSQQSAIFTHSYSTAGTYTPSFTVTNSSGQSAHTSLSVNVGNVTTTNTLGDVNGDGVIDCVNDIAWLRDAAAGNRTLTVEQKTRADINGDGIINIQDVILWNARFSANCGTNTGNTVTVVSPNGGEVWAKGTMQNVTWQDTNNISTHEIKLAPYNPPCTSKICPMILTREPYSIANTQGSSYAWSVGKTLDGSIVPDGQYTIQICQTGTGNCDSSDNYFTIGSSVINPPTTNGLSISPEKAAIKIGEAIKLQAMYNNCPAGAQCFVGPMAVSATWTSSDTKVATVSTGTTCPPGVYCFETQGGLYATVKGIGEGTATITATYNGYTANAVIKVYSGTTTGVCEYANPPVGYHYAGGQPYPVCGAHLVIDSNPNPTTGTTDKKVLGAENFHFTSLLKMGSTGSEVTELQKFLNGAGYDCGNPDGNFGLKTETAVVKFQSANGLTGDGIVGAGVRAVLNK